MFSDGGLFDNSPLGVTVDISKIDVKSTQKQNFIYINPDHYRSGEKKEEPEQFEDSKRNGLWDYADYFLKSFGTAQAKELQEALVAFSKQSNSRYRELYISERYHNLLADFHAHFAAFYSEDFRHHDYLVGVYDGMYLSEKIRCKESGVRSDTCVEQGMLNWLAGFKRNRPK